MSSYQTEEIKDRKFKVDVIRKHIRGGSNTVLDEIDASVNWYGITKPIERHTGNTVMISGRSYNLLLLVKSIIVQKIYALDEFPFQTEVADRKSFQKFLNLSFGDTVPDNETLTKFQGQLENMGAYEQLFDTFFKNLLDADIIPEQDLLLPSEKKESEKLEIKAPVSEAPAEGNKEQSVEDMIEEIENRVKNLYEKKSTKEREILEKNGFDEKGKQQDMSSIQEQIEEKNNLYQKLTELDQTLKNISKPEITEEMHLIDPVKSEIEQTIEQKTKGIFDKLNEIDERLKSLNAPVKEIQEEPVIEQKQDEEVLNKLLDIDEKLRELNERKLEASHDAVVEQPKEEDVYKKLFDSFYNKLVEADLVEKARIEAEQKFAAQQNIDDSPVAAEESLIKIDDAFIEVEPLKTEVIKEEAPETTIEEPAAELKEEAYEEPKYEDYVLEGKVEETTGKTIPVVMHPPKKSEINLRDKKKYPIFNNSNLTEDYELGLRFYKLGFKTTFVNLKTDRRHGNSRIATGEYFPNTFWGSVKQRSRWIAGIAFQNTKIHKWEGSAKTKYFLLRDRKSIISATGTLLAYLVLLYYVVYFVTSALGLNILGPLVERGTTLWYLVLLTLFFAISRLFHRFAFTYNWYGLRYAIAGVFRVIVDNVVNFFATFRAIKVFRQTKGTVVWDSTEHY